MRKQKGVLGRSTKTRSTEGKQNRNGKGNVLLVKSLIPIPKLLERTQKVFNKYIRERDRGLPCISCGKYNELQAGHYVPQKGGSYLRFHEWNVHGECQGCNGFDQFHLIGYRRNLVNKIGEDAVKWLEENRHVVKKWTRSELEEIIQKYNV
jgi:ribonuclease I